MHLKLEIEMNDITLFCRIVNGRESQIGKGWTSNRLSLFPVDWFLNALSYCDRLLDNRNHD